jgi:hypothetical protein
MLETDHEWIEKMERQVDLLVGIGGLPLAIRIALQLDHLANDSCRIADTLVDLDLIREQLKVRLRAVLAKLPGGTQDLVEFLDDLVKRPTGKIPSHKPGRRGRGRH